MTKNTSLEELYVDSDEINEKRLSTALEGLIGIDQDTGDPVYLDSYFEFDEKPKFVAQLLYWKAAVELGDREPSEQGGNSQDFAESLDVSHSSVQNYASDLPFVETVDEKGGYVITPHKHQSAIRYLEESLE